MLSPERVDVISDIVESIVDREKEKNVQAGVELEDIEYYKQIVDQARKGETPKGIKRKNVAPITPEEIVEWWNIIGEDLAKRLEEGLDYEKLGVILDENGDESEPL